MKIYTEVVYHWDDAKGELVKESEKSFDYNGPLTLCWVQFIPAIIAGIQLSMTAYGQWKGQQAQEEQNKIDAQRRAQQKALAIEAYTYKEGQASGAVAQLENVLAPAIDDAETAMMFEAALVQKRNSSTIKAQGMMNGQSSKFFTARVTGDHLRKVEANKDKFTSNEFLGSATESKDLSIVPKFVCKTTLIGYAANSVVPEALPVVDRVIVASFLFPASNPLTLKLPEESITLPEKILNL